MENNGERIGNIGRIEQVDIDQEMRSAYIDYSMSVIVSRALPDVRDGMKPVHRRVLFGMDGLGLSYSGQTTIPGNWYKPRLGITPLFADQQVPVKPQRV